MAVVRRIVRGQAVLTGLLNMLSEKLEYMGAFVFNRKQARTAEVFSLELIIIVSHMGTCMLIFAAPTAL